MNFVTNTNEMNELLLSTDSSCQFPENTNILLSNSQLLGGMSEALTSAFTSVKRSLHMRQFRDVGHKTHK